MNPLIPGLIAGASSFAFYFTKELAEILAKEVGKDVAEILDKLKDVVDAWLDGHIEAQNELCPRHFELQNDLNKRLLPPEDITIDYYPPNKHPELKGFIEIEKNRFFETNAIENKIDGEIREDRFYQGLLKDYPYDQGFRIEDEVYLRDMEGDIVKDSVTGEARRVDFVVIKDDKVVKSFEVTSQTAPKEDQMAKESRIREVGGDYMKDIGTGKLLQFDDNVTTEVVRLA
jgi:predicted RNase H-like HicB family nuclease